MCAPDLRRCVPISVDFSLTHRYGVCEVGAQAMAVPNCAQCDRPATTTIPTVEEHVCNEHAAEFWQALLRFAVGQPRPVTSPEAGHTVTRTPRPALLWRPRRRVYRESTIVASLCAAWMLIAPPVAAQGATHPRAVTNPLRAFNESVQALSARVSQSVVQVLVTGYGPVDERGHGGESGLVIGRQRSIGSGAIVDPDGYIVTNAHVVAGARRIQVVVHRGAAAAAALQSLAAENSQTVDARVVGTARDIDLALLKIDVAGLRALPLANYDAIRQGEIVFAFGSPEGLRNSVTMGVVSAVARQPDPDSPTVYIQTDAPINPGNSGGPLVNVDGELVGVNTLILTESGGSQGLGFAIPSAVVASVCPQLRKYGHLHRGLVGFSMQAITPALAAGLGLSRTSGVVVSDVMSGGAAETAGVGIKDVVATVNGKAVESVPMLALELSRYAAGDTVKLGLLRGAEAVSASVLVGERPHLIDQLAALADPDKSAIPTLGIIGVDVGDATARLLPEPRISSGVFVAARIDRSSGNEVPLVAGDVIHALNSFAVRSVDGLRVLIDDAQANTELVLEIERNGQLMFVTCEIY
jgi:serine protease Do